MKPAPQKLTLCANHDYLTYADCCSCANKKLFTRYRVIGTNYCYLHTSQGDMRLFKSYSGAYKAAKRYVGV